MPRRISQVDELLRSELAVLISREIPLTNGLITVTRVRCTANLQHAKVFISILPENQTGTALRKLKGQAGIFSKELQKKLKLRFIPRFSWVVDDTEIHAAELEKTFKEIEGERR